MNLAALGDQIKYYRKRHKLTIKQLATAVNISVSHLEQIECGSGRPSIFVIQSLANALNIPIDCLFQDYSRQSSIVALLYEAEILMSKLSPEDLTLAENCMRPLFEKCESQD